jgi:hypothetical protein
VSGVAGITGAVIAGLTGNDAFPSPPVELPVFQATLTDFTAAITATAQGGTAATAHKKNKRKSCHSADRFLSVFALREV